MGKFEVLPSGADYCKAYTQAKKGGETVAFLNPINISAHSGAGLALWFKGKEPQLDRMSRNMVSEGLSPNALAINSGHVVTMNCVTKREFFSPSPLDLVFESFRECIDTLMRDVHVRVVHIPALGCGLGHLSFKVVKEELAKIYEEYSAGGMDMDWYLYPPRK